MNLLSQQQAFTMGRTAFELGQPYINPFPQLSDDWWAYDEGFTWAAASMLERDPSHNYLLDT